MRAESCHARVAEGTCAYLDAVYWMHDVSMLYTFIMWGVLLEKAVFWITPRGWRIEDRRREWEALWMEFATPCRMPSGCT